MVECWLSMHEVLGSNSTTVINTGPLSSHHSGLGLPSVDSLDNLLQANLNWAVPQSWPILGLALEGRSWVFMLVPTEPSPQPAHVPLKTQ